MLALPAALKSSSCKYTMARPNEDDPEVAENLMSNSRRIPLKVRVCGHFRVKAVQSQQAYGH
jgi:hypothetical protein